MSAQDVQSSCNSIFESLSLSILSINFQITSGNPTQRKFPKLPWRISTISVRNIWCGISPAFQMCWTSLTSRRHMSPRPAYPSPPSVSAASSYFASANQPLRSSTRMPLLPPLLLFPPLLVARLSSSVLFSQNTPQLGGYGRIGDQICYAPIPKEPVK